MSPFEVAIHDVAAGGDGIGHGPDGRIVFVRGAIPGDTVAVDVTDDRPKMVRGAVSRVVEPSPDRVDAPCVHLAEGCGGCDWQHIGLDAQRRHKIRIAEEALRRIGRIDGRVELGPSLPSTGFRTTIRVQVEGGRAGFRAARSHDTVPVEQCLVAHPALDELLATGRFGSATEVTLRVSATTGQRVALVSPRVPTDLELPADVLVVGDDQLASGRRAWFTESVAGRSFRVSVDSFFQTRTDGAAALVDAVRQAGDGAWGRGRLVDLYGGVGLFAGCLGEGMTITLVEASRAATADARHNLADRDARVIRCAAARWRPGRADLVVADPPRAGLGRDVVARVASTGANRVVLVSCDPASFGRDAGLLHASGYRLRSTVLVDLFPHTSHVELVSRFDAERSP